MQTSELQPQVPAPTWSSQSLGTPDTYGLRGSHAANSSSKFTLWLVLGVTAAVLMAASCVVVVVIAVRFLPDTLATKESISTPITTSDSTNSSPASIVSAAPSIDSVPPLEETLRKFRAAGVARYQRYNSRLPDSLEALVPEYLQQIPKDPVDSKPIRYKKEGELSCKLYSIGLDRQDNGGESDGRKPDIALKVRAIAR